MKKKNTYKKMLSAFLAGVMAVSLAACGKGQAEGENDQPVSDSTYVYVPEFRPMNGEEESYSRDFILQGNRLYFSHTVYGEEYVQSYRYLDMTDPDAAPVTVYEETGYSTEEDGFESSIQRMFPDGENGVVLISAKSPVLDWESATEADYRRRAEQTTYDMKKIAEDGTVVFDVDITEYLSMDQENFYLQYAIADGEGNLFISNGNSYIWIFDREGAHINTVQLSSNPQFGGYINGMGILGDGRVGFLSDGSNDMCIFAYNAEKRDFSDSYGNLPPECWNSGIAPGPEGGVLINGQDSLYEYDPESQTYKEILKWMDCDMHPDYVRYTAAMEDGSLLVYYDEWGSNEQDLVFLKKTPASEVVQKQVIVLGCMSMSQGLQAAIVNFNKSNTQYKIEVKDYTSSIDWSTEESMKSYEDAVTRFHNDIVSGNAPDLFLAEDVNLDQLAALGVIEDLNPYLETSTVVSRSDLFESVLDAYTLSGVLCTIPDCFNVSTLVGRTSEVGEEPGWTLEEMIAYADEYPEAAIFPRAYRSGILQYCLMFNFDSYVNWETGECSFDTEEFKSLLEFASRYGEEPDYSTSEPKLFGNHEALLNTVSFSDPWDWQIQKLMFNEPITAIGFPTTGSNGIMVQGSGGVCISASSQHKEAAWAFIESLLTEEAQKNDMFKWGFPIRRSAYDDIMEEAMEADYQTDEDGNLILDEDGNPIEISHRSYGWEDVTYEVYAVTQEEADQIASMIEKIDGPVTYDVTLMNIIDEEVAPYFAGQKSVDEVADAIQGRVKLYVDESR